MEGSLDNVENDLVIELRPDTYEEISTNFLDEWIHDEDKIGEPFLVMPLRKFLDEYGNVRYVLGISHITRYKNRLDLPEVKLPGMDSDA